MILSTLSFALTPASGEELQPVSFDDTVTAGGTAVDVQRARAEGFLIPRSEVFFSNYRYVVGYYGVEATASELTDPGTRRQFGESLAVYVSDFSTATPRLTGAGFVTTNGNETVGWAAASDAFFVVDSDARIPSGPVVLPFSDRADANRFVETHGGTVVDWETVRARDDDPVESRLARFEAETEARRAWANDTVAASRTLLDRPRSVVVGEDAPNVSAAVAAARPNTTVYLPAGTYETDTLVVEKPITIAGAGVDTTLRGDRKGSVVHAPVDRVAFHNLRIDGVGIVGSRGNERRNDSVDWDTSVQLAYGYGDAGIVLDGSNGSVVSDVAIQSNSSGVIARESDRTVVDDVTVRGAARIYEGFMGTIIIDSRSVVQNSTFLDGRDGVYTHRADGTVIRDNRMRGGRYGVHQMYTHHSLVTNNVARDTLTGINVMTQPTDNIVVGNDVRDSKIGIVPAGSDSLFANNVLANNEYGLLVFGDQNAFVDNVVVGNDVGARATDILPLSWVFRNDFVDNDEQIESDLGPLQTWTHRGVGNYWGALPIEDADGDAVYDRGYQATGAVDSRLGDVSGATSLAQSPAAVTLRRARDSVSGLRQSGVLDTAPRTEPFHGERVAAVRANTTGGTAA